MKNSGYIALISAIIISVILMLIVLGTGLTGFSGRFNILDSEWKERSTALAEGCLDTARLKLAVDPSYTVTTPETITIGSGTCQIISVSSAWPKTIVTQAKPNNIYTNLTVVVPDATNITSWQELP